MQLIIKIDNRCFLKILKPQNYTILLALLETTNLTFSLGSDVFRRLPNIADLFSMSTNDLVKLGLPANEVSKLKKPNWCRVEQSLHWAEKTGNHIITIQDPDYPILLKEIPNSPVLLFVRGDLQLLKSPQIAIVGSRNPTSIGLETAAIFAQALAQAGLVVTSGFAAGIDAAGHRGAIAVSQRTIAVMGTGLKQIYPLQHKNLAQKILDTGGVLLSEFPLEAKGNAWHFPLRNRIISGLSFGTLVVEATIRSGSLITARLANEQGREVFAIPGSIYNPLVRGCHYLICQGVKLVAQPSDVLEELTGLNGLVSSKIMVAKKTGKKNKLDQEYTKLLDCVGFATTTLDMLVARTSLSVQQISVMLLELELQGVIKTVVGGYTRVVF